MNRPLEIRLRFRVYTAGGVMELNVIEYRSDHTVVLAEREVYMSYVKMRGPS
jgi:hypothetical protein